ncbi:MAG: hypothetical protein KDL87_16810, partial [Verrucomicrobiae bacterium]|nr:hypothetical protein [Verrucomicrobiae bacterium]
AYFVTFNSVVRIDGIGVFSEVGLWALSGGFGGLVGSLGLVSLWAIWFPMAEPWPTRVGLVLCGSVLGTSLTLWKEDFNPGKAEGFFVLWQAGMAAALATVDALGRRRSLENAPKC